MSLTNLWKSRLIGESAIVAEVSTLAHLLPEATGLLHNPEEREMS
jgi:hypothetical protein